VLAVYLATGLLLSVNWLIYVWGVNEGYIVETSLGYFINPLLSVLLGVVFLRERLRLAQWLPISLAAAGVVYLFRYFRFGKAKSFSQSDTSSVARPASACEDGTQSARRVRQC